MGVPNYHADVSPKFFSFCGLQALACKFNDCYILPMGGSGDHHKAWSMGQNHFLCSCQGNAGEAYDPFLLCGTLGSVWVAMVVFFHYGVVLGTHCCFCHHLVFSAIIFQILISGVPAPLDVLLLWFSLCNFHILWTSLVPRWKQVYYYTCIFHVQSGLWCC